jgi:DNA-binding NtrC family response regulator
MPENKMIALIGENIKLGQIVSELLNKEGLTVLNFESPTEALVSFKKNSPHVLIIGYRLKGLDGLTFLRKIQLEYAKIKSIMMTEYGTIDIAVEAIKLGAFHYLTNPYNTNELISQVKKALIAIPTNEFNSDVKDHTYNSYNFESIIGKCSAMQEVFNLIRIVASSSTNVLIFGESGTGKELVARALHYEGPRKNKAFIPINCTAIPEQLLESELFGHVKGSFTGAIVDKKGLFEEADGGTLFLDEIGDLSLTLQVKLLRVLQDKEIRAVGGNKSKQINVRIISATHRDLKSLVKDGRFREDLYYRLNVVPIRVPPLRERKEDIPLLVETFIEKFSIQNGIPEKKISSEVMVSLLKYSWPGNVRELENVIERLIVLSSDERLEKSIIVDSTAEEPSSEEPELLADRPTLEKLEERYIKTVLNEVANKKNIAAQVLGISRRTLYRKERIYGLNPEEQLYHEH